MGRTELRELSYDLSGIELRSDDSVAPVFEGYAIKFNKRANIGNPFKWGFIEEIMPGALDKTSRETDQRFLIDHDSSKLVARRTAGDLSFVMNSEGWRSIVDPLDMELSYVRDFARNVEKRRITGMSFQFEVVKDGWSVEQKQNRDGDWVDVEVRQLFEITVPEVSAVTFPAYQETTAALRAVSMRDDPDPLGRRAKLLHEEDIREPGGSTRERDKAEPGETTLSIVRADLVMGSWAARTGLPI